MTNYSKVAAAIYHLCAANDPYMPALEADVATEWGRAFATHRLSADDLVAGVHALYAERGNNDRGERFRVMPADICLAARKIRRERTEQESAEEQARRLELRDREIEARSYEAPAIEAGPSARDYSAPASAGPKWTPCPKCEAKPGKACVNPFNGTIKLSFHPEREKLAAANADAVRAPLAAPDPLENSCPTCESRPGEKCQSGGLPMFDTHPERRPLF